MQCNNCGRRFRSDQINVLEGGCNPAPLERKVVDGQLVIQTTDLEAGSALLPLIGPPAHRRSLAAA